MLIQTVGDLLTQGPYSADSICGICLLRIRGRETKYHLVEEVIDQEHLSVRVTVCTIDATVKLRVCHVERRFPDIGEL